MPFCVHYNHVSENEYALQIVPSEEKYPLELFCDICMRHIKLCLSLNWPGLEHERRLILTPIDHMRYMRDIHPSHMACGCIRKYLGAHEIISNAIATTPPQETWMRVLFLFCARPGESRLEFVDRVLAIEPPARGPALERLFRSFKKEIDDYRESICVLLLEHVNRDVASIIAAY